MNLFGPYLVACGVLVAAGVSKSLTPAATAKALAGITPSVGKISLSERSASRAVRVIGLLEVSIGAIGASVPCLIPAAFVGASYVVFGVLVLYVRRRHGVLATCGCFSRPDTPATRLHLVIDAGLLASSVSVCAADVQGDIASVLSRQPLDGVPMLAACAVGVWLVFLAMVDLPRLAWIRRGFTDTSRAYDLRDKSWPA